MENRFLSKAKGQTSKIWYYGMLTFYSKYTCYIKDDRYNEMICGNMFKMEIEWKLLVIFSIIQNY